VAWGTAQFASDVVVHPIGSQLEVPGLVTGDGGGSTNRQEFDEGRRGQPWSISSP
jgi:hypothetical protein